MYKRIEGPWRQYIDKGGMTKVSQEQSLEHMRRKLWGDVVLLEVSKNPKAFDIADLVLKNFDQRFGKGDGE